MHSVLIVACSRATFRLTRNAFPTAPSVSAAQYTATHLLLVNDLVIGLGIFPSSRNFEFLNSCSLGNGFKKIAAKKGVSNAEKADLFSGTWSEK